VLFPALFYPFIYNNKAYYRFCQPISSTWKTIGSVFFVKFAYPPSLLKAGAEMDVKTEDGKTALDFAREKGHQDVVILLKK